LRRILALKAVVGLDTFTLDQFPAQEGLAEIGKPEYRKVAEEIADKSVTLVKHTEDIFPVTPEKYKRILLVPIGPGPNPSLVRAGMVADGSKLKSGLIEKLRARGFTVEEYVDPVA